MKRKVILVLVMGIILSACTRESNPLSNIEDVVSGSQSTREVQKNLENPQEESQEKDLSASQLENDKENVETAQSNANDSKSTESKNINLSSEEISQMSENVTLKTSKGDVVMKLYPDVAPETVKNFLEKGVSGYYEGLTFHRVEDWVVQGGDPLGNGTGGGKIKTELSKTPFVEGSLGVARGGDIRVSNDSQFFFCTKDCGWLDGQYTNFGEVTSGMDVVKSMEIGDKILSITTDESTN